MKRTSPNRPEKDFHDRLCNIIGCVACLIDGHFNNWVSIHHCDGRTKPDAHMRVIPLCAGHHQDGTGEDKTMIAVHPYKKRFETRYGTQKELTNMCFHLLAQHDANGAPE